LTVGPKGKVCANIKAHEVAIYGSVRGNVEVTGKLSIREPGQGSRSTKRTAPDRIPLTADWVVAVSRCKHRTRMLGNSICAETGGTVQMKKVTGARGALGPVGALAPRAGTDEAQRGGDP